MRLLNSYLSADDLQEFIAGSIEIIGYIGRHEGSVGIAVVANGVRCLRIPPPLRPTPEFQFERNGSAAISDQTSNTETCLNGNLGPYCRLWIIANELKILETVVKDAFGLSNYVKSRKRLWASP